MLDRDEISGREPSFKGTSKFFYDEGETVSLTGSSRYYLATGIRSTEPTNIGDRYVERTEFPFTASGSTSMTGFIEVNYPVQAGIDFNQRRRKGKSKYARKKRRR